MNLRDEILKGGWNLFLDRDGVINRQVKDGYVLDIDQFEFLPGAAEAIQVLNRFFDNIFIVTNQQCIGKGLLDMEKLSSIHNYMLDRINQKGGHIMDIFVSPFLDSDNHPYRKPGTGMALDAIARYPSIDLKCSVMAGDSPNDMLFGKNSGMFNVFIGDIKELHGIKADLDFRSLSDFASYLENNGNDH